jgi:hypothetical protein
MLASDIDSQVRTIRRYTMAQASSFYRKAAAISMIGAGVLILAGVLIGPWQPDDSLRTYLLTYAAEPVRAQTSAVVLHFGFLLLLPTILGLAMVTQQARILNRIGLGLGILGAGTLPGLLIVDFYDIAIGQMLPIEQGIALEEKVESMSGQLIIFLPTIVGLLVALILLGIAAWRVGFAPWWSPALVVAGFILPYFVGEGFGVGSAIGAAITLIGLTDLGRRMLTQSPEQTSEENGGLERRRFQRKPPSPSTAA